MQCLKYLDGSRSNGSTEIFKLDGQISKYINVDHKVYDLKFLFQKFKTGGKIFTGFHTSMCISMRIAVF